jgi:hypothetical protein
MLAHEFFEPTSLLPRRNSRRGFPKGLVEVPASPTSSTVTIVGRISTFITWATVALVVEDRKLI